LVSIMRLIGSILLVAALGGMLLAPLVLAGL
jgi:hypothetical protein